MSQHLLVDSRDALSRLGDVLLRAQVVNGTQWETLLGGADESDSVESLLTRLSGMPAWWSPAENVPALTAHQRAHILRKFPDQLDQLEAVLRLNDYLVLDKLGKGGMGVVYHGWDLKGSRFIAIKAARDGSAEVRSRFEREIRIQQALGHPSINRFLAVEKARGRNLLVLEYINGRTLVEEVRARGRIPWPEVACWAIDLLGALEHAHQKGIIHRDIKPSNVMTHATSTGVIAKLLDMGLAKCAGGAFQGESAEPDDQTRADQVLGSYDYMPPEQWKGGAHVRKESDLYCLGGTLYFALAGRAPFVMESGDDRNRMLVFCNLHTNQQPPSLRSLGPDIPAELDRLILQMLAKDPDARGSATELRAQVQRILRGGQPVATTDKPNAQPVAAPTSRPVSKRAVAGVARQSLPPRPVSPAELERQRQQPPNMLVAFARLIGALAQSTQERSPGQQSVFGSREDELSRHWQAFLAAARDGLLSLLQPWRYPIRALVVVGILALISKWLRLW